MLERFLKWLLRKPLTRYEIELEHQVKVSQKLYVLARNHEQFCHWARESNIGKHHLVYVSHHWMLQGVYLFPFQVIRLHGHSKNPNFNAIMQTLEMSFAVTESRIK